MFGLSLFALLVIGFIALAAVIVVVVIVVFVITASRNREVGRLAGVDTVQGQARPIQGVVGGPAGRAGPSMPAASHSIKVRLLELDGLRSRGVISYDEYVSARQRAIEGSTSA